VSWFFLYRTEEYKKVAAALEAKTAKRECPATWPWLRTPRQRGPP